MTDQVGPYRIVERLGAGGMGEVFLAEDVRLGRKVALKSLSPTGAHPAETRRKLLREARAAARLNHPNIAAVYDVVDSGEHAHIVMEYVPGETIAQRLARGPMPAATVLELADAILEALVEAHAVGIVHRDLKPSNIAVGPGGKPKILDFGLAHSHSLDLTGPTGPVPAESLETATHAVVVGTPHYMPPEHLLGRPIDVRGDVYSLGVTLFEMLCGSKPFAGADAQSIITNVLRAPLPRVRERRADVPRDLEAVIARAMAREPEDRYASAAEMREALRRVDPYAKGSPTTSMAALVRLPLGRRRVAAAGLALAAVAAAAVAAWRPVAATIPESRGPQVVAVLPLRGEGADPQSDALGAGMADLLASSLSKVSGVTVLPRSATLPEKDASAAPLDVARRVGASLVVDGRVQRAGDRVRLVVQMVRAGTGAVAWSETYEGTAATWFDLQPRIAEDVATALRPGISRDERRRLKEPAAVDPAAFADYAQGWSYLERVDVPGSLDHAVALFEGAVRKAPRFARAHAGLGHAAWEKFRATGEDRWASRARDAITEALRLDPADAGVHHALAVLFGETGRPAEAAEEARQALLVQPDFDLAHALLGDLLADAGNPAAEGEYRRAIALRPGYWRHHLGLGVFYFTTGRVDEAIGTFRRVTELRPDSSWGFQMLGTSYHTLGRLREAVPYYETAIRLGPDARAYSNLGTAYYQLGRLEEARAAYVRAAALEPADPLKRRNLADLHRRTGNEAAARREYQEALRLARKRLEVNPRDARSLALAAVVEAKLGAAADAQRHAAEAVALSPTSSDIWYKTAVVHALTARPDDALAALSRAMGMGFRAWEAAADEDLASLRTDARFVSMTAPKEAS